MTLDILQSFQFSRVQADVEHYGTQPMIVALLQIPWDGYDYAPPRAGSCVLWRLGAEGDVAKVADFTSVTISIVQKYWNMFKIILIWFKQREFSRLLVFLCCFSMSRNPEIEKAMLTCSKHLDVRGTVRSHSSYFAVLYLVLNGEKPHIMEPPTTEVSWCVL